MCVLYTVHTYTLATSPHSVDAICNGTRIERKRRRHDTTGGSWTYCTLSSLAYASIRFIWLCHICWICFRKEIFVIWSSIDRRISAAVAATATHIILYTCRMVSHFVQQRYKRSRGWNVCDRDRTKLFKRCVYFFSLSLYFFSFCCVHWDKCKLSIKWGEPNIDIVFEWKMRFGHSLTHTPTIDSIRTINRLSKRLHGSHVWDKRSRRKAILTEITMTIQNENVISIVNGQLCSSAMQKHYRIQFSIFSFSAVISTDVTVRC